MTNWIVQSEHAGTFLNQGYCVVPVTDLQILAKIRTLLVSGLRANMTGGDGLGDEDYLNQFHKFLDPHRLNDIRVKVHSEVCGNETFKKLVFQTVAPSLFDLIGREIVMQRQVNFVVHLPGDTSNLIYLHTDSWSGCSPYEVILWLPLVNVFGTKSMYIVKREPNRKHLLALRDGLKLDNAAQLMERIRPDSESVKMNFGQALLFSPILLHGAENNATDETRFILNVRFKGLFSPYGSKALGETFLPIHYLPTTEIGLDYESQFGVVSD